MFLFERFKLTLIFLTQLLVGLMILWKTLITTLPQHAGPTKGHSALKHIELTSSCQHWVDKVCDTISHSCCPNVGMLSICGLLATFHTFNYSSPPHFRSLLKFTSLTE